MVKVLSCPECCEAEVDQARLKLESLEGAFPKTWLKLSTWAHGLHEAGPCFLRTPALPIEETRIIYPEPDASHLPATAHLLVCERRLVTAACDTGAPTADQASPG